MIAVVPATGVEPFPGSPVRLAMFARILLLFLITPIVELALLIQIGAWIGFWPTVGIVVLTALVGSAMLRREGLAVWRRFNERLNAGGLPGTELVDGVIVLLAGALLITPGVISDLVGIFGLFPPSRALIRRFVMKKVRASLARGSSTAGFFAFGSESTGEDDTWGGQPVDTPRYERREEGN